MEEGRETNPVLKELQDLEIARNMLLISIPLSGFVSLLNPRERCFVILTVSMGAAAILNGLMFRRVWRRASAALELGGITLMLLSFFGYLSSHLPAGLAWFPMLCFVICLVPMVVGTLSYFRLVNVPEAATAKENASDDV